MCMHQVEFEVTVDESFGMDESADSTAPARQAVYKGKLLLSDITHDGEGWLPLFPNNPKALPHLHLLCSLSQGPKL